MTGFLKGKIIKIEILSFLPSSLPFTQLGSQRRDEWEEGNSSFIQVLYFLPVYIVDSLTVKMASGN